MTNGPGQPYGGFEPPRPAGSPPPADGHPPVDYPGDPGLPPPVHPDGYAHPGYPPQAGHPGPVGYPAPYAGGYGYGHGYGHGYGPDPYDPYRPARPVGTNGKAIAALVTSLAGLLFCVVPSIVGLILGIVAMRETRRTGQDGYGLALAGVIIGGLATAGLVLYILFIIAIVASGGSPI